MADQQIAARRQTAIELLNQAPLFGFVRTTPKQSPLVGIPIESPEFNGQVFPILAYWQYGLGKSVAFTSSPGVRREKLRWDTDWANSDMYTKFWEQCVTWALRPTAPEPLPIPCVPTPPALGTPEPPRPAAPPVW